LLFGLLAASVVGASDVQAQLVLHRIAFAPSLSPEIAGYELHLGRESGSYVSTVDIGAPPVDGEVLVYEANLNLESDLYVALTSYDAYGSSSGYSNEIVVAAAIPPEPTSDPALEPTSDPALEPTPLPEPAPSPEPTPDSEPNPITDAMPFAVTSDSTGMLSVLYADGVVAPLTLDSLATSGDLRPARCDLDADGDRDIVLGFGPGSAGQMSVIWLEGGVAASIETLVAGDAVYHEADGSTRPACGDIDGDGRDEIVVGLGAAGEGWLEIFDDAATAFAPFAIDRLEAPRSPRAPSANVPLFPALGDIDGDQRDELVVGYGFEGSREIAILDDASTDFAPHPNAAPSGPIVRITTSWGLNAAGQGTVPTIGDWDGDGLDEIVVGFGQVGDAWLSVLDNALTMDWDRSTRYMRIRVGPRDWSVDDGLVFPQLANIDDDPAQELVVGFGGSHSHRLRMFDDFATEFTDMTILLGGTDFTGPQGSSVRLVPAAGR
jgi:hypothetical protein